MLHKRDDALQRCHRQFQYEKNEVFAKEKDACRGARARARPTRQDKQRLMLNKRQRSNRTAETESTDSGERSEGGAV